MGYETKELRETMFQGYLLAAEAIAEYIRGGADAARKFLSESPQGKERSMSVVRYQCLFSPLEKLPAFEQLIEELTRGGTTALYGPDDSQKAHLLAAAQGKLHRPMLILTPNDGLAQRLTEDMNALLDGGWRLSAGAGGFLCKDGGLQPGNVHAAH